MRCLVPVQLEMEIQSQACNLAGHRSLGGWVIRKLMPTPPGRVSSEKVRFGASTRSRELDGGVKRAFSGAFPVAAR